VLTNVGAGRDKILLRGVSDGALTGRAQSTVGLYFGDVRLTYAAPDPDLQLVDVQSVDVLRGPQGALYGAGAIGGVVRIEPTRPDLSLWGGSVLIGAEETEGDEPGRNLELVANAPLIAGRLAVRGVYYDQVVGGWIDNSRLGLDDTNSTARRGGRLAVRLKVSDAVEIDVSHVGQLIDSHDSQYLTVTPEGPRRIAAVLEPHDNDLGVDSVTLRATTRLGDLTSTTAQVHHELRNRYDATGVFGPLGVDPVETAPMDERAALDIITHETKLSAPLGARIPWLLGVFLADGDNDRTLRLLDGSAYTEDRRDGIDELALFGETTWRLAKALSLETGVRLFKYRVRTRSDTTEPRLSLADSFSGAIDSQGVAPDLRLSYRPARRQLVYLSAAEGHRAPGFNTGGLIGETISADRQPSRMFAGDELWTYELGARLSTQNDRLAASAVAFINDWRNIQTDDLIADHFSFTGNVGHSRATGYELDVRYRPLDAVTIRAHALFDDPELQKPEPTFPAQIESNLPGAPKLSGSLSIRYARDLRLGAAPVSAFAESAASYVGRSQLSFGLGPMVGDYVLSDLRLGLSTDRWDLAFRALNLGDSRGATVSDGNPYLLGVATMVTPLRPRTVGVSLRRRF
jgi:outer membrane receptor protein involved in Fe transport